MSPADMNNLMEDSPMKPLMMYLLLVISIVFAGCDGGSSGSLPDPGAGGGSGGGEPETYVSETVNANGPSVSLPENVSVSGLDGDNSVQMASMTPTEINDYSQCILNCSTIHAEDQEAMLNCVMDCMEASGMTAPGGAFQVEITLTNSSGAAQDVTLNAGTVLTPSSSGYQPMLLIDDIVLTVSPGETTFTLPVYCMAPDKDAPDSGSFYTITGLTTDSCLQGILAILATKDIDSFDFADVGTVQDSIWNCVEDMYTAADTAALNALP